MASTLQRFLLTTMAILCFVSLARAQPIELKPNQNFVVIQQQPLQDASKIEVIDFFWYGCPYCYELLPQFNEWLKTKPDDVVVRRIPAVLRESWLAQAHMYYTLDVLGEADKFHDRVFDAHHKERLISNDPAAVAEWAIKNGFDKNKWQEAYASREVPVRVRRAYDMSLAYSVPGTPAIVVDGRFMSTSGMAGGVKNLVPVMEALVNVARERRAKAATAR
jgi:thiol:disulfide interchange protein DsbA